MSLPKCQLNELVMNHPSFRSLNQAKLFSIILNRSEYDLGGWCKPIKQETLAFKLGIDRRDLSRLIKGLSKWVEVKRDRGQGDLAPWNSTSLL